jgi:hypothetical protein
MTLTPAGQLGRIFRSTIAFLTASYEEQAARASARPTFP